MRVIIQGLPEEPSLNAVDADDLDILELAMTLVREIIQKMRHGRPRQDHTNQGPHG